MTVAALPSVVSYTENGSTTTFAVPFRFKSPQHLTAKRYFASGASAELVYGTDFTASGGSTDSGGTLTVTTPAVAGTVLRIRRRTPRAQSMAYTTNDRFPAASHEGALDNLMLVTQEIGDQTADTASRAVSVAVGLAAPVLDLSSLGDGDLLEYRGGRLQRLNPAAFAGKFYAGDAQGRLVPATGTGADGGLRLDLATTSGAALVGYRPTGGTVSRSIADVLDGADVLLAGFGVSASAPNNAALIEAAIAAKGGGRRYRLPAGVIPLERELQIKTNIILFGEGDGPIGGTTLLHGPGFSAVRVAYNAGSADAYDSVVSDLKFQHNGTRLATTATASFAAATRMITITGGTNDYATGQVIRMEGCGTSHTLPGKTAAITSGNNVATITSLGGNPGVYVGQWITIAGAGLPAATKVTAVTSTTITLSSNATATVAGAAYTIIWPMFATISSGGGSASLVVDAASHTQDVTGAVLSHHDVGIVIERTCTIERTSHGGGHGNIVMRADASYDANANTSKIRNNRFGSCAVCLVTAGWDANACVIEGNDFSTYSQIGALENSLIGNFYTHNHFAFNIGIASPVAGNQSRLSINYFENGTSYPGNSAGNVMNGNQGLAGGCGWAGFVPSGAGLRLAEGLGLMNADVTDAFYCNGTKVVGARVTGAPAAATDPATTQALANWLRSALIAHGAIS